MECNSIHQTQIKAIDNPYERRYGRLVKKLFDMRKYISEPLADGLPFFDEGFEYFWPNAKVLRRRPPPLGELSLRNQKVFAYEKEILNFEI